MKKIAISIGLSACVLGFAASHRDYKVEEREAIHQTFQKDSSLDVDSVNGSITVLGDNGSTIRVETRRGAVEILARADHDVPANMVFIPFCYAEAAANLLTNPALDPFGKIPEFKFCAARIGKI